MYRFEFDTSELTKFYKDIESAEKDIEAVTIQTIRDMAQEALSLIIDNTPVRTGELKASWTVGDIIITDDDVEIEVYTDLDYAPYVEYGHRTRNGGFVQGQFIMTLAVDEVLEMSTDIMYKNMKKMMRL